MPSKNKTPTENLIENMCELCCKRETCDYFNNFSSRLSPKSKKDEIKGFSISIMECEDFKKK